MLPVSSWPPGPPGAPLSPFGRPRTVNLASHPQGFVIPKGAWAVQTGSNQVLMFRPSVDEYLWNNPPRTPGTGFLPGQGPGYGPPTQPCRPCSQAQARGFGARGAAGTPRQAQVREVDPRAQSIAETARLLGAAVTPRPAANANFPKKVFGQSGLDWPPPVPERFWKANAFVEAWRAWQRRVGRTDPPIEPTPGRRLPNFWGWRFRSAPATVLVPFGSGGTVLADGQNVVIAGAGFANITQAFSV